MTLVELFDKVPIENIASCLAAKADKLIIVGDRKSMMRQAENIQSCLEMKNLSIAVEYRSFEKRTLDGIVSTLIQIVKENGVCSFDLTGGDDLLMVALGIVWERCHGQEVQLHKFNIRTRKVMDCDADGVVIGETEPELSVEENIVLHGGRIIWQDEKDIGTIPWIFDDVLKRDVSVMWELCRKNCGLWNMQISMLETLEQINEAEEDCVLSIDVPKARTYLKQHHQTYYISGLFSALVQEGLISEFYHDETRLCFRYQDEQVRDCLTKAGTVLELKTFFLLSQLKDAKEQPMYQDVMTGVAIDWDGILHTDEDMIPDTENEIDVLAMHGLIPVFISCKNGGVGSEELYKLNTVAERFGENYAKKVLVATNLNASQTKNRHLESRARDMQITLLRDVHLLDDTGFLKKLKSLTI